MATLWLLWLRHGVSVGRHAYHFFARCNQFLCCVPHRAVSRPSKSAPLLIGPLNNMLLQSPFVADKIIIRMEGQYKEVCKLHSDRSVAFVSDWPTEETTEREEIHSPRCAGGSSVQSQP